MKTSSTNSKILKILLKDFAFKQTISSLAKELNMSRAGIWKVLKRMESERLIVLSCIGTGKTSTGIITLNFNNPLTRKNLALILTEDAVRNKRWMADFAELENKSDFLILYGSILHSFKDANDIDLLCITGKNNFLEIEKCISKMQKTQIKKIHILCFTQDEFRRELKKPNKAFIDAIKKGIVLFGQENFIHFIEGMLKNE